MALGSTQPLVKMSTWNIPGGKGGRCVRLTTSPPSRAECHEIREPKPPGILWATPGLLWDSFTFYRFSYSQHIMGLDIQIPEKVMCNKILHIISLKGKKPCTIGCVEFGSGCQREG